MFEVPPPQGLSEARRGEWVFYKIFYGLDYAT